MYSYDFSNGFRVFKNGDLLPKLDYVDDPIEGNEASINNALFWYKSYYDENVKNLSYGSYVNALSVCDADEIPTGNLVDIKVSTDEDCGTWAYSYEGRNGFLNSPGLEYIGKNILTEPGPTGSEYPNGNFFTFRNLNIPANATIHKAYIKIWANSDYENEEVSVIISCHKNSNSTDNPYGTPLIPPEDRDVPEYDLNRTNWEVTDAKTNWNNIPYWYTDSYYITPDLSCLVQEVINLPGWVESNAIKFFFDDNSNPTTLNGSDYLAMRGYYSYHSSNQILGSDIQAPELIVWYTIPSDCEPSGLEQGSYNYSDVTDEYDAASYAVDGTASDEGSYCTVLQNNHISYNQIYFGGVKVTLMSPSFYEYSVGTFITFDNVQIPKGVQLNKAQLVLQAHHAADDSFSEETGWTGDQTSETVIAKITAHKQAHSPDRPIEDYTPPNNTVIWERTDSEVQWNSFPTWYEGEKYNSPNIACIIQEIINLPDWEPGNSIKIFIDNDRSNPSQSVENSRLVALRSFCNFAEPATQHPYPTSSPPRLEFWYGEGTEETDLILGGSFDTNFIIPSGELILGGGEYSLIDDYEFDLDVLWNIKANIDVSKTIYWNIGDAPLRWYRVEGCCIFTNPDGGYSNGTYYQGGCNVSGIAVDDNKCLTNKQYYIQNILGSSVADVCEQIADSKMNWKICSLKRWSRPADERLVDSNDNCNTLSEVPYCEIPECLRYCLDNEFIIEINAETFVIDNINTYTGSGTAYFSGESYSENTGASLSNINEYTGSGTAYFSGTSEVISSWETLMLTEVEVTTSVENFEVSLSLEETSAALTTQTDVVATNCGCNSMPLIIYMHHNLLQDGVLFDFLQRNGYSINNPFVMYYNPKLERWISNLHFKGFDEESWRFTFEWSCVNQIDENQTSPEWRFSMLITRINQTVETDTRVIVTFPQEICDSISNLDFDFIFNLNTSNDYVSSNINVANNFVIKSDNIGLFKTKIWTKNPKFVIRLSKDNIFATIDRQDISEIFPKNANLDQSGNVVVR